METPYRKILNSSGLYRLNRTMQYGNPGNNEGDEKEAYSLNRTMQYGNIKRENAKKQEK